MAPDQIGLHQKQLRRQIGINPHGVNLQRQTEPPSASRLRRARRGNTSGEDQPEAIPNFACYPQRRHLADETSHGASTPSEDFPSPQSESNPWSESSSEEGFHPRRRGATKAPPNLHSAAPLEHHPSIPSKQGNSGHGAHIPPVHLKEDHAEERRPSRRVTPTRAAHTRRTTTKAPPTVERAGRALEPPRVNCPPHLKRKPATNTDGCRIPRQHASGHLTLPITAPPLHTFLRAIKYTVSNQLLDQLVMTGELPGSEI